MGQFWRLVLYRGWTVNHSSSVCAMPFAAIEAKYQLVLIRAQRMVPRCPVRVAESVRELRVYDGGCKSRVARSSQV